jgi:hypothetical protein
LAADGQYHVRSEDGSMAEETRAGNDLMSNGLKVKLPNKYSSDVIFIEQSKQAIHLLEVPR